MAASSLSRRRRRTHREMRTAMFEKLKFTVKKEKEVGKVLNLRGNRPKRSTMT